MRAYFVMYAMNAAVQKAGLLFHPWKKKNHLNLLQLL